jgi:CheY-like chemotaxis protein
MTSLSATIDPVPARIGTEATLVTPRQRKVIAQLDDRARRTELLAALAGAGGFGPEGAASVLAAELGELETTAREVGLDGVVAMVRAARRVIEQLGGVRARPGQPREVIVLDEDEITRDLIALALQAEGHRVRCAASVAELAYLVSERKPHALITDTRLPDAPAGRFGAYLRRTITVEGIPIVVFSSTRGSELARLAREAGAECCVSKHQGVAELLREIGRLFDDVRW